MPIRLTTTRRIPRSGITSRAANTSADWQQLGIKATMWGIAGGQRAYELAGLLASMGEQLGLASVADHEVACWHNLSPARTRDRRAVREMSARALVELEAHYVLAAGHSVANAIGRVIALDPATHPALRRGFGTTFEPGSSDRLDWFTMSRLAGGLPRVVGGIDDLAPSAALLADLHRSEAWTALEDIRGEDFHRWRPQTAGLSGAARASFGERMADGSIHIFGGRDEIGTDLPARLAMDSWATTRAAFELLLDAVDDLDGLLDPVLDRLTTLVIRRQN